MNNPPDLSSLALSAESRAAAGAVPILEWDDLSESFSRSNLFGDLALFVQSYGSVKHSWHASPSMPGMQGLSGLPEMTSRLAAKLAIESLLALATAPLHAAAETAALEALRERCAKACDDCGDGHRAIYKDIKHPEGYDPKHDAMADASWELADIVRALPLRSGEAADA